MNVSVRDFLHKWGSLTKTLSWGGIWRK